MRLKPSQLLAAGVISGFLVLGGVSLASAQETPGTTVPTSPSTETPQAPSETTPDQQAPPAQGEDPNCPNMGGEGSGTGTGTSPTGFRAHGPRSGSQSSATATVDAGSV